jgi:hypothetical protein
MNPLEKWNPFRASPSWDPIRQLEELQNRVASLFARSFTLPEGAAGDKVSAEFKDGVLKVRLPKDEKAKPDQHGTLQGASYPAGGASRIAETAAPMIEQSGGKIVNYQQGEMYGLSGTPDRFACVVSHPRHRFESFI